MRNLTLLITILLISCGNPPTKKVETNASGVVIGKLNWQDISLKANLMVSIKDNARAVGDMMIPAIQSRCTGFLITDDILMTNNHCISSAKEAQGVVVDFIHEINIPKTGKLTFKCDEFIGGDKDLDYALIKCRNRPGEKVGRLKFKVDDDLLMEDDLIYLIHHNCDYRKDPRCDWSKKISPGKIQSFDFDKIRHSADSLKGSSGAPLIDLKSGLVIGIHHAGKLTNKRTQAGIYNEAIKSERILEDIEINFPQIFSQL